MLEKTTWIEIIFQLVDIIITLIAVWFLVDSIFDKDWLQAIFWLLLRAYLRIKHIEQKHFN
jgi:hypothetical protein